MILLRLGTKSLLNRKFGVFLSLFTIAISVMMLLSIERVRVDAKASFASTLSGTDLIVGARTGDIQLLLASVFRVGHMNNGVSWQSYLDLTSKRGVSWSIPLSLGDAHKGYPLLGTSLDYFSHYRFGKKQSLTFAQGQAFATPNDVVLGAEVAKTLGYSLGDKIVAAHGLGKTSFHHHDNHPLTVVGILAATGTPVDKTLHVPLKTIDLLHGGAEHSHDEERDRHDEHAGHHDDHEHGEEHTHHDEHADNHDHGEEHQHHHDEHAGHHDDHDNGEEHKHHDEHEHTAQVDLIGKPTQISAFLLGFDSPFYTLQVQRNINTYEKEALMAIMPAVTLRQLWDMLGMVEKMLLLFSILIVVISLLGMLTTLLANLSQRRRELAILRSVGAKPWHIFSLMSLEALLITLAGCTLGVGLFYALIFFAQPMLQAQAGVAISLALLSQHELTILLAIVGAGWVIGILPAAKAYFYSLHDGMSVKN